MNRQYNQSGVVVSS